MGRNGKGWFLLFALIFLISCAHTSPEAESPRKRGKARKGEHQVKAKKPLTAEEELKQGDHHLARGEVMGAVIHYQNALEKDPSLAKAHLQMAKAYGKQRRMGLYEKELQEAVKVDPELAEARYLLASWYFTSGRNKEALAESEVLIKSDPENEKYRLFRVMIYDATKDYKKAIEDLGYLVKVHPQKAQYLLSLGAMYRRAGDEKKARKYLQKVKEVAPKSFEAKMAEEMLQEGKEKKK
ncbi:MAG: tetratricopeptide repeat protein [Deltaproteobacteria bacterium]|nr:tetratricopeptide repeat protein [Deltaproteobacteria bacterium]